MTIQEFIEYRISNPQTYELNEDELKCLKVCGAKELLLRRLTSSKFRKTSLDDSAKQQIKSAIDICINNGSPIKLTYPFGGYKSWRTVGFPNADMAELMTLSYVIRYAKYLSVVYSPGVIVQFTSDDVIIEKIDNYRKDDLDAYSSSFLSLIELFKDNLPSNVKVEYRRVVPDLYNVDEYSVDLEAAVESYKLNADPEAEHDYSGFEFNFLMNGSQDYTGYTEEQMESVYKELTPYSVAYLSIPKRRAFNRGEDKIVIFSQKITNAIDIGSTSSSKAKFWAGTGVLEIDGDRIVDRIVSPKQFELIRQQLKTETLIIGGVDLAVHTYQGRLNFK